MEKFPTLKIFVAHGGGYLPAYSGRIDHAWGARPDCRGYDLKHKPSDYLKRMYFDTVVFSFDQLKYLIDKFGSNHIIMGTDYPYDMAEDDPIEHVLGTDGLSQNDIKLITGGNACSLFKII
jgi:aminocarboxymuconate-semialdehyde decarboxylase